MKSKYLGLIAALALAGGCGLNTDHEEITFPDNSREERTNYAPRIEMVRAPKQSYTAGEKLELEFRVLDDSGGSLFGSVDYDCPPPYTSSIITSNRKLNRYETTIGEEENPYVRRKDGMYSIHIHVSDWDNRAINGAKEASTSFFFKVEGLKPRRKF